MPRPCCFRAQRRAPDSRFDGPGYADYRDYRLTNPRFAAVALLRNMALVDLLRAWGARKGAAPAQIALAWLLAKRPFIVPIPGTTDPRHLDENLGAAAIAFLAREEHSGSRFLKTACCCG